MLKKIDNLFYIIIPLLILGVPFGYSSFLVCLFALILRLVTCNKSTAGIALMMYAGSIGGIIRFAYPALPIYGVILTFLGFLMLFDNFRELFSKNSKGLLYMVLVFLVLFVSYEMSDQGEAATQKWTRMISGGITGVLCYYAFINDSKIVAEKLTQSLMLMCLVMIGFWTTAFGVKPGGLLDFDWLRASSELVHRTFDFTPIGYHHIGMCAAFAGAIFFSQTQFSKKSILYYGTLCLLLIMMSGARQFILAYFVCILLRLVFFRDDTHNVGKKILLVIVGYGFVQLVLFVLSTYGPDSMASAINEGDSSGRDAIFEAAWNLFLQHPIFGSGLGGFDKATGLEYPHNMILEILCECGLFGLISLFLITFTYFAKNKVSLLIKTNSNLYFFLVLAALFVRVMISVDLTQSIEIFSAISVTCVVSKLPNNGNTLYNNNPL